MDEQKDLARHYVDLALDLGADNVVAFQIEDIEFDPRTILKCAFGCEDWGKGLTCPSRPNSLKPWEYEQVLKRYRWGIIIHSTDKRTSQSISFQVEREAFLDGFYFAFSLSDCALCEECAGFTGATTCLHPKQARPAFHSVGIDVFKTVRKFGLPIETLKSRDEAQNWYSAVFIE
jgi:predicted metal-binding protein